MGGLPFTWILLRDLPSLLRRATWSRWRRDCPERLLLALWVLLPLAVFCAARSRLHLYLLPLFVPLALLAGIGLRRRLLASRRRIFALAAWLLLLSCLFPLSTRFKLRRNSELFAATVRQAVPGGVEELVFLDGPPAYGLGFYLDVRVRAAPDRETDVATLAAWMRRTREKDPRRRLWVSGPVHRPLLSPAAKSIGCRVTTVTHFARWSLHRLDCAGPAL